MLGGGLLLTLTGCHTTKNATSSRAELKAESERFETALQQALTAESFQSKVTVGMSSLSLKGQLKMHQRKDLLLQVNAPLLGFEIARVQATTDSLWMVDKYDKVYVALSIKEVSRSIGGDIDLEALQCLLTGRIYVPGRGAASKSDFKRFTWTTEGDNLVGTYTAEGRYTLSYTINADNYLSATTVTLADGSATAAWNYANHTQSGNYYYPQQETLKFVKGERTVQGSLNLNAPTIPAATWNAFQPGSGYKQVEPLQLIETLKKAKN
jgi:outer membrane biogenesis lipoprotein LolB